MGDARATSSSVAALVVSPMPSRSCASSSACWRIGAAGVCRRDRFTVLPVAPAGHVAQSGCRKPSLIESAMTRPGPTHGLVAHYDYIFTAQFNVCAASVSSTSHGKHLSRRLRPCAFLTVALLSVVASNRECCASELKCAEMSSETACPMLLDAAPTIVEVQRVASIAWEADCLVNWNFTR
jgi:hypothetical protein